MADPGRSGEVRFLGEIANTPGAVRRLLVKLTDRYHRLRVRYG